VTLPDPQSTPLPGVDASDDMTVRAQLAYALERTQTAVAVWDAEDRLTYANDRYREMFPYTGPFDGKPTFAEIQDRVRRFFKHSPSLQALVDDRIELRRRGDASGDFISVDGRIVQFHDIGTPDGGIVTTYEDVTRQRSAEATLSGLAKTIPGAIFELRQHRNGRLSCTYMSDRIHELTGIPAATFVADWSHAIGGIISDAEMERLDADLGAAAARLTDWRAEFPISGPDGDTRWLRGQASTRRLPDDTVVWSGLLTDGTQSVESNAALTASERRFRDIIDIASDWIWETDTEGRFIFLSERFTEISGLPTEQLIGHRRTDLTFYDTKDPGLIALEDDMHARRPIHGRRLRLTTPNGDRQISLHAKPIFDDAGAFLGYRGTGTDVSREHDYVQRLREAMLEAQTANQAKSRFLASMSHDLRTPLNAVMGFSEMMQAEVFGPVGHPRYAEYIRDIRMSAIHLLELIDDLLDLARIESGRVELVQEHLVVADLIDEAMTLVAARCQARGVSLSTRSSIDVAVVRSDRRAVKQILVNLLTNAAKYTDPGGTIEVTTVSDLDGGIWVSIRDNGCGIAEDMLEEVTKPFVQIGDPATRKGDGVGLGLAIVRSLTEAIGAEFRIESRLGEGTTVAFRLPSTRSARAA